MKTVKNKVKKAWEGRFEKASHPLLEDFNASLSFDRKLYGEDVDGSIAHALMLSQIGVLTKGEFQTIKKGLLEVREEIDSGRFNFSDANEDIHMAIEARLTEKIGALGGKLHTARSRNDQVALDLRLFCKRRILILQRLVHGVQESLLDLAQREGAHPLPGYTHLQRAQPILLAHHLLAYFEMLSRDVDRFSDTLKRTDVSPLGSGALAGTTFPIQREVVAKELGLGGVTQNSLDSVSDRDFAAELLFDIALLMAHLSRFAEELILWSTQEFGFISLPQEFCTGSSMMPQKINPDVPELIRGKTGRAYGNLVSLLTVIKGLPLAYNKDLQEDKEPLFDSVETAMKVLSILKELIPGIKVHPAKMKAATEEGFLLATDLADYLVSKKIPFREAHAVVGEIIRHCLKKGTTLEKLPVAEMKKINGVIGEDVRDWLDLDRSINRRGSVGGTASKQVLAQLKKARSALAKK